MGTATAADRRRHGLCPGRVTPVWRQPGVAGTPQVQPTRQAPLGASLVRALCHAMRGVHTSPALSPPHMFAGRRSPSTRRPQRRQTSCGEVLRHCRAYPPPSHRPCGHWLLVGTLLPPPPPSRHWPQQRWRQYRPASRRRWRACVRRSCRRSRYRTAGARPVLTRCD